MSTYKYLKICILFLVALFSAVSYSQTPVQRAAWAALDTVVEIQKEVDDFQKQAQYCTGRIVPNAVCTQRINQALSKHCISKGIRNILVKNRFKPKGISSRYQFHPVCDGFDDTLLTVCKCGCFIEGTKLLSMIEGTEEWVEIEQLMKEQQVVIALSDDGYIHVNSTVEKQISENPYYLASQSDEEVHDVVKIKTINDATGEENTLVVTTSHPIVLADSTMVEAVELTMESELISDTGDLLRITSLDLDAEYTGKVYNVDSQTENNIIFAEGIAVGDLEAQMEFDARRVRLLARQ